MTIVAFPHQKQRRELRAAVAELCAKFDLIIGMPATGSTDSPKSSSAPSPTPDTSGY